MIISLYLHKHQTDRMKKILCIFGFCCLLTLGFSSCQQEEDALVQLSLEDLQKRDSKKHPKLEYITTDKNNRDRLVKSGVYDVGGFLFVILQTDSNDYLSIVFKDKSGKSVYKDTNTILNKERCIQISPSLNYPYTFEIKAKDFKIRGSIIID